MAEQTLPPFIQTYIVPVCLFEIQEGRANIRQLSGTAFFINRTGAFLTAAHVMCDADVIARDRGWAVGLCVKDDNGASAISMAAPIARLEYAPTPHDVAIGQANYQCPTTFHLRSIDVQPWQDVAVVGYPLNAVSGDASSMNLNIRCHKGYIQRLTRPGDVPLGEHPDGFELSFLLSDGLSGAPLFIHLGQQDIVVGVCVGSIRSEILEHQQQEIVDGVTTYKESRLRIDQYGLAHDIRPLLSWRPSIFDGLTVEELCNGAATSKSPFEN